MTDSTLRTAIARALFLLDYGHQGEESWEAAGLDGNDDRNRACAIADAVLAVLANPPAEVVARAADRYVRSDFGCQCASCADTAKEHVLGVLAALVGGGS